MCSGGLQAAVGGLKPAATPSFPAGEDEWQTKNA